MNLFRLLCNFFLNLFSRTTKENATTETLVARLISKKPAEVTNDEKAFRQSPKMQNLDSIVHWLLQQSFQNADGVNEKVISTVFEHEKDPAEANFFGYKLSLAERLIETKDEVIRDQDRRKKTIMLESLQRICYQLAIADNEKKQVISNMFRYQVEFTLCIEGRVERLQVVSRQIQSGSRDAVIQVAKSSTLDTAASVYIQQHPEQFRSEYSIFGTGQFVPMEVHDVQTLTNLVAKAFNVPQKRTTEYTQSSIDYLDQQQWEEFAHDYVNKHLLDNTLGKLWEDSPVLTLVTLDSVHLKIVLTFEGLPDDSNYYFMHKNDTTVEVFHKGKSAEIPYTSLQTTPPLSEDTVLSPLFKQAFIRYQVEKNVDYDFFPSAHRSLTIAEEYAKILPNLCPAGSLQAVTLVQALLTHGYQANLESPSRAIWGGFANRSHLERTKRLLMLADLEAYEGIVGAATSDYKQLKTIYSEANQKQQKISVTNKVTNRFDDATLDPQQKQTLFDLVYKYELTDWFLSEAHPSIISEYFDHYAKYEYQQPTTDKTKPYIYYKYLGMKQAGLSIYDFHTCNDIPIQSRSWAMFAVATAKDGNDFSKIQTKGYPEEGSELTDVQNNAMLVNLDVPSDDREDFLVTLKTFFPEATIPTNFSTPRELQLKARGTTTTIAISPDASGGLLVLYNPHSRLASIIEGYKHHAKNLIIYNCMKNVKMCLKMFVNRDMDDDQKRKLDTPLHYDKIDRRLRP